MNTWAAVITTLLAASIFHQTTATDSRSFAESHLKGIVNIADAATNTRSLLAAKDLAPAPAPVQANSSSPNHAPGPALIRNVTSLAAVGNAYNPNFDITGNTVTTGKNMASGYMCVIFGSDIRGSCENEERPVPACCSSQGGDAVCNTFDNGGRVGCSTASQPYPACCENRNQPRSVCTVPASDTSCGEDYPVPACCDSTFCTVFKSGDSVQCQGSNVARCCPS